MRLPIPIIFIWFIIFIVYLAFKRTKQTQNQQNANQSFLERERLANNTRKKDISGLNYLPFTTDRLPRIKGVVQPKNNQPIPVFQH